ncbi:S41 family peptidase [Streptoalloteichus hindustanus]|uniref:Tricorn protease homolog n=1 Tax=Streptoalloteichus hindustanus TaxID=2017 RepID=A0A1M5KTU0_STRHI|nr:S41 family peptidase [Streptoalloteichus hindustanus]SHG56177.1 tricorn protease [Streptoalloteichus hindustanus]
MPVPLAITGGNVAMVTGYLRFPHLHGGLVTFVAEDDVWLAPLDGGRAWRVSADRVPVNHPRFSPDGDRLAWTSHRDGAPEVHVAAVDGGPSQRLTHWGDPRTSVRGWTPDGAVLAISATGQASTRRTWAHAVPVDGGPARRLPYGLVSEVAYGPDNAVLLVSAGFRDPSHWKRYRGGTIGKLWLGRADGDDVPEFHRILSDVDGQLHSAGWVGDRVVFLSDHEGVSNLYSCLPDGSDLRKHSHHTEFYARHATTDGTRVVYHCSGQLWLLEDLSAEPRPLEVRLGGPRTARQPYPVRASSELGEFQPDRTGRASAVEVRGTVHWLTHRDGPAVALTVEPGVRARLPVVLGDSGRVAWVTDANGEDAIEIAPVGDRESAAARGRAASSTQDEGSGESRDRGENEEKGEEKDKGKGGEEGADKRKGKDRSSDAAERPERSSTAAFGEAAGPSRDALQPRRLATGQLGRVLELVSSPDGRTLAVATHDGRLLLLDVETAELRQVLASEDGEVQDLVFSPDSAWLAWSHPGPPPLRQIRVLRLADLSIVDVTSLRFLDYEPVFTLDGKHLVFLSVRTFDPVYDAHVFDLSFTAGCRPHLVPLGARTPSPFDPRLGGRPAGDADDDAGEREGKNGARNGEPEPVVVDVEGIAERVVPFPVPASNYSSLRAGKGGVLWLREPLSGTLGHDIAGSDAEQPRPVLERFDLRELRCEELVDGVDAFDVSGDGARLVLRDRGALRVQPSDRKAERDSGADGVIDVDLSRIRVQIDPGAEWRQSYHEAGRLMRDHFWRADMGGVDWDAALGRHAAALDRLGSHDDLVDLLWEAQGELATSHAYVVPPSHGVESGRRQGLLGADLERAGDGTWRVARVLPGESSDPDARSPLAAPGVGVRAGDVLVAVDGRPVDPTRGPGPLLAGTAGKPVELVVRPADGGATRRVVVRPLDSEEQLRYHDWVAGRRRHVHELSEGRVGYLHVPDMVASGWAQLHRDLRLELRREALVVDVRENRGGHTSQLVVEKLARRVVGWDYGRGYRPVSYPMEAPRGPVVAVANEFSGSDGDIVNAAIKALGIGPVVGVRTWGGVIGIDSRYHLVDGTLVTQPRYATWLSGPGWGVENHGVDPDVEVVMTPQDWATGRDPQLDTAVRLALETLAERPAATPPPLPRD